VCDNGVSLQACLRDAVIQRVLAVLRCLLKRADWRHSCGGTCAAEEGCVTVKTQLTHSGSHQSRCFWLFHGAYWLGTVAVCELFAAVVPGTAAVTGPAFAVRAAVACGATAGLRMLSLRQDWAQRLGLSRFGVLAGGCTCLAVTLAVSRQHLEPAIGIAPPLTGPGQAAAVLVVMTASLIGWMLSYLTFRVINDHDAARLGALEAQAMADRHELEFLRATMDPHFVCNALTAVMAVKHDPDEVERISQALADYLRFRLRPAAELEPLGRELDAVDDYIAIQDARFGEDLICTVACERQARQLVVPSMLIQPLLENAVKYGADTSPRPLRVDVRVSLRDQMLHIEVANTGQWVRPGSGNGSGLGLRALRKRLQMLYGDAAWVSSRDGHGWVRVEVAVPAVAGRPPFAGSRSRVAARSETVAAASSANGVVAG